MTSHTSTDPILRRAGEPLRNLLIVHTPNKQDISDWLVVKQRIDEKAPGIEVRIATNGVADPALQRWQVTRPSLVFSPCRLVEYRAEGGTVWAGRRINKIEQLERLARRELPTPLTAKLTRNFVPDPRVWGRFVVVKPSTGTMARGIRLLYTVDVAARYDELTLNDTQEIIIQPYIEHSQDGYPTEYRVLTLFGMVLYAARNSWAVRRPALEDIAADPHGIIASNNKKFGRVRSVCNDAEIIALGERAHAAFPECPLLGVDVVRCMETGKLYVMEVNPAGETWHLSSPLTKTFTAEHRRELYAQFGALDRTAELLIERTRAEAV